MALAILGKEIVTFNYLGSFLVARTKEKIANGRDENGDGRKPLLTVVYLISFLVDSDNNDRPQEIFLISVIYCPRQILIKISHMFFFPGVGIFDAWAHKASDRSARVQAFLGRFGSGQVCLP
jgi:hypothetical protein